jgi:hypothetical protein
MLKHSFLADVPYLADSNYLEFCDTPIGTEMFYQAIDKYLPDIGQFYIATNDDSTNIQTALKLSRYIRSKPERKDKQEIMVLIRDKDYCRELNTLGEDMIHIISIHRDIYTYGNLLEREADKRAKDIHENYKKTSGSHKEVKEWSELDIFAKDSNRASARDKSNKEMLFDKSCAGSSVYWKLAVYEHFRWCAFHYARGWTRLLPGEFSDEEKAGSTTKRVHQKKHLCLVDWETLPFLPGQADGVSYQKYDYDSVKALFNNDSDKGR